jgi:replicative DNA helicase
VCFIAKNREGQVGKVTLRFQAETVHFYEPTDRRRPEEEGHA